MLEFQSYVTVRFLIFPGIVRQAKVEIELLRQSALKHLVKHADGWKGLDKR